MCERLQPVLVLCSFPLALLAVHIAAEDCDPLLGHHKYPVPSRLHRLKLGQRLKTLRYLPATNTHSQLRIDGNAETLM